MRESKIEAHLRKQVKLHGGVAKKLNGRIHDPDRLARAGQVREHKRLRDLGFEVRVLSSVEAIDAYIKREAA